MIQSKPKSSVLISIALVLVVLVAADAWLFVTLIKYPASYFWWKLVFAPTLLVIAIAIARKGYNAALQLSVGNNKLSYRYLLGAARSHPISEVKTWYEEVVKNKNVEYKRLTILLATGRVLHLSNKENSQYQRVVDYLQKKAKPSRKRS